ncbi:AAA family ATPase [Dactylosporangium sp. NPDC000244]|uniref:AAA family ATPase n=1 Tax=Dactylosporangium sp. NPDC000244 TaxID=3154365 RepID=UPI003326581A
MTTLIATRGLPGSGKTTKARAWVAQDVQGRARINRDDLRAQLHDGVYLPTSEAHRGTERIVVAARNAAILALLSAGVDVVCDETNLSVKAVEDLRRLADDANAVFEVWDLADVPLAVCLQRNSLREGRARIPEDAVRGMFERHVAAHFPQPLPLPGDEVSR